MTVTERPTSKALRPRFTEHRRDIIATLAAQGGTIEDRQSGRATLILHGMLDSASSTNSLAGVLLKMEADGLVSRVTKGKRTYAISAVDPSPDPRFQEVIDEAKPQEQEPDEQEQTASVLDRLHEAQADIDARKSADVQELVERAQVEPVGLPSARAMMAEHDGHTVALPVVEVAVEPEVEPFPSVDPINYDALAGHLLNRVLEVSSQDKRYIETELERARIELGRARTDMRTAREDAQRFKARLRDVEEDLGRTRNLLVEARRAIRDRDANIQRLTSDHRKAVAQAISDKARRELERTMTEAPKHINGGA